MNIIKSAIAKIYRPKTTQKLVNCIGKIDDRAASLISEAKEPLQKFAQDRNLDITLAQKGNLLLINSGFRTSTLNLSESVTPSDIVEKVYQNTAMYIK